MSTLDGKTLNTPLQAVIIGGGFAGIGMAIELRKQFFEHFAVLERGDEVGGVWRDNTYPGAACDVPSHLYSFSFEPKPDWSHVFAAQSEILEYLKHCADKYDVRRHFRFNTEVQAAQFLEAHDLWEITVNQGESLYTRTLITAMGQLSRPVFPKLKNLDKFTGKAFHSARWDHSTDLLGKRVAVVGTGASAIQFVPAIAGRVKELKVFQRTPSHIIPRPDRPYSEKEKNLNIRFPILTKLRRLAIYTEFEARAIGFTRFKKILEMSVGRMFKGQLQKQVSDNAMRRALTPTYPIGCKRILISSNYYPALTKESTQLITQGISKAYEYGLETEDGRRHEVDVIVFGTGFAATEFLSPLKITGLNGLDLNTAWQKGAKAHLGMTVPDFPNLYMLYGPNTNLGHNSIVYMLESQIHYISRVLRRQRQLSATRVEVNAEVYKRFNAGIQKALGHTVWNGCKSWYVDENGHNSTGWPGFTLTYRWLTRFSRLHEFAMTGRHHADVPDEAMPITCKAGDPIDNSIAAFMRLLLRVCFKPVFGKPFGIKVQRTVTFLLEQIMPGKLTGTFAYNTNLAGIRTRVTVPRRGENQGAVLFLHGGAFCVGSPHSHRSLTSWLASESGLPVYAIDYRLAPEHPYPACLDDAVSAWKALLNLGYTPDKLFVSGDSAGGGLTMALAIRLKELGLAQPAGLGLISPMIDHTYSGSSMQSKQDLDPMLRKSWAEQSGQWLKVPAGTPAFEALNTDLSGLAPMLIQVGDQEILLSDSSRLAVHARHCEVPVKLEVYEQRWHVFHLQAAYMKSSEMAIKRLADFAVASIRRTKAPQLTSTVQEASKKAA